MNRNIKKHLVVGAVILALAASTLQGVTTNAASIKISKKQLTLKVGKSHTLKIKGTKKKVVWKSSAKKVATVSKKGKVTAKKVGKATITAKIKSKTFRCKVTVKPKKSSQTTQKPSPTQTPSKTSTPSAGITEQSAYATLNSLRSTYPEGMSLTNENYSYSSPCFGNGRGCYGFAAKLSDTVFGTKKAYTTHKVFSKIKTGDNIRIGGYHSVIVLTKENSYITVVEGNFNSSVHWDRKITADSLASEGFTVYTRY